MERELLKKCAAKGFLLDKNILKILNEEDNILQNLFSNFICKVDLKTKIISTEILIKNKDKIISNLTELEKAQLIPFFEKVGIIINKGPVKNDENKEYPVKILNAPAFIQRKITLQDFVQHFRSRYEILKKKLEKNNFEDMTTIRRLKGSKGTFTLIAMISEKRTTKNKNIILQVEDLTGSISVLVNKNKKDVYDLAKELVQDEVVALNVSNNGSFLYCNSFIRPKIALQEKKKAKEDIWVAFISDLHTGSIFFLEKNLLKFIQWLNGVGEEKNHKDIANKIKYLFIGGDLVDGVSHYPGQEKHLDILSTEGQYKKFYEYVNLIRKDINIIACSGNHDAVWVGEPQPIISERWAPSIHSMENFQLVPNPAMVEIVDNFKVLMYHGASMFHYMNAIPRLRVNYGLDTASVYVDEMLKRAHLSPMHGAVDYIPCEEDSLTISKIPDIILTGDIHRSGVSIHNNILAVAGSCWQSQTPFFEKVGIHPDPCKVTLFNLKTREVKILDFSDGDKTEILEDE